MNNYFYEVNEKSHQQFLENIIVFIGVGEIINRLNLEKVQSENMETEGVREMMHSSRRIPSYGDHNEKE